MPALSRNWTCDRIFKDAHRGVFYDVNDPVHVERFQMVRAMQEELVGVVFDVVSQAYMEPNVGQIASIGKKSTAPGTFTLLTKTVSIAMSSAFAGVDRGNAVMVLTDGLDVFLSHIDSVTNGTDIVLRGPMPAANDVVDYVLMAPSTVNGDAISLELLNFMRAGNQIKMSITTDATRYVEALGEEEFAQWLGTDEGNRHKIVWMLIGDIIYFKKGSLVTDYGTITLWLPRVPIAPQTGAAKVDIIDGVMISLGRNILEREIRKRKGLPYIDRLDENAQLIQLLYKQFQGQVALEEIEKKAKALA